MIGSNVSTVGGIVQGFRQAKEWALECIQIYTTPSRTWSVPRRDADAINKFLEAWENSNVQEILGHVPFLVNLGAPNPELYRKSIDRLVCEIESAEELKMRYIVMHPGTYRGRTIEHALDQVILGLNEAIYRTKSSSVSVLLETMAGQGNTLGDTLEQFAYIVTNVEDGDRVGVCCDTCHIYAAGYDIRGASGINDIISEINHVMGLSHIKAFHLNDSRHPLGSKKDKHCSIGKGYLGLEVFQTIVQSKQFLTLPKIIENPDRDFGSQQDVLLLKELRDMKSLVTDPECAELAGQQMELPIVDEYRFRRRMTHR